MPKAPKRNDSTQLLCLFSAGLFKHCTTVCAAFVDTSAVAFCDWCYCSSVAVVVVVVVVDVAIAADAFVVVVVAAADDDEDDEDNERSCTTSVSFRSPSMLSVLLLPWKLSWTWW